MLSGIRVNFGVEESLPALPVGVSLSAFGEHLGFRLIGHALDESDPGGHGDPPAGCHQLGDGPLGIWRVEGAAEISVGEVGTGLSAHRPAEGVDMSTHGGVGQFCMSCALRKVIRQLDPAHRGVPKASAGRGAAFARTEVLRDRRSEGGAGDALSA
ncbi:hypothetical protein ACI798_03890 [Geodermatophilus sp. SYSU D01045]